MITRYISPAIAELICENTNMTLRRKGEEQTGRIARCTVPASDVDNWEEGEPDPYSVTDYEAEVEKLIRERYTVSQELALLRQRDSKPEEFAEYNSFAETCKELARANCSGNE